MQWKLYSYLWSAIVLGHVLLSWILIYTVQYPHK